MSSQPPPPLRFSRDLVEVGDDDHRLREGPESRRLVRLRRGAYIDQDAWAEADRDTRYSLRIAAAVGTRQSSVVLSHHSAARIWSLPIADAWPPLVHITESPESGRRSRNGIRVHRTVLGEGDTHEVDGLRVTSLTRTLLDLAAEGELADAVVAIDAALARTNPRRLRSDLEGGLEVGRLVAARRARRAVEFASDLSESPGESWSRVVIGGLGFPSPILQQRFDTATGSRFADFWWPEAGLVGEFDGRGKYAADPLLAVLSEKRRENELRESGVRAIARWGVEELRRPDELRRRLEAHGLTTRLGRGRPRAAR